MKMLRRVLWSAGAPIRAVLVGSIRTYRAVLSPALGGRCRFYPSCSHYAQDAIELRGAVRGGALAVWRILRCNPFGRGGIEQVRGGSLYDAVLRDEEQVTV